MTILYSIEKLCSILSDVKNTNMPFLIYGNLKETFSGMHSGLGTPPNNSLSVKVVAYTAVGIFYCHEVVKLTEVNAVESIKKRYQELCVKETEIELNTASNTLTLK